MEALSQLQDLISSLQTIKRKLELIVFSSVQSNVLSGIHPFKDNLLREISSQVQKHIKFCEQEFITKINKKISEYEEKSCEKLFSMSHINLNQPNQYVILGQDLKDKKKELMTLLEEKQLGPILSPNIGQELNNSQEIRVNQKHLKGSQSNRSYHQSYQSFYSAIQSQNLQDFKYKYLVKDNLETDEVRQDAIITLNKINLEKFYSMDVRSDFISLGKKNEKETQTIEKLLQIRKAHETKVVIKKKEKKLENLKRSSTQVQQALLEIIYGKDLFPFIKFYLSEIKQNRMLSALKSIKSSYSEQKILTELESQRIQEGENRQTIKQQEYNPLIKYMTKGNAPQELTVDEVMEAKFQRLVIICFDTLLHTLKTMSYFMPLGELTEIVVEIRRDELNVLEKKCLGNQQRDIEKICKKVKKIMKGYRAQMKGDGTKRYFFNKNLQIKTTVA